MKIGIDARLIRETGVGRYIRNLVGELATQDKTNEYVVFLRASAYDSFSPPNARWSKALAEVPWHTFAEQLIMPWILFNARLDLVHIPYFNIPIFYPGRMVATIHDLTILHFDTGKATTLPLLFYKFRRLGYRIALELGLRRARAILAVSKTTKQEVVDHFGIDPMKIIVAYEGVDEKVKSQKSKVKSQKPLIENPYFLYVGNAYPHKSLETLLRAFNKFLQVPTSSNQVRLVLVGKDDFFYRRIMEYVHNLNLDDNVIFFGQADDRQLANLYAHAIALVFPSLMEGFGLPALEALALGCPVIVSDIPVFHEILGDQATYFHPSDFKELAQKLSAAVAKRSAINQDKVSRLLTRYSWSTLSSETLRVYVNIC
ncbi:hypothetical protein A2973_00515 [Candidatus Gottesmanbacteria bacterium RIFCSPLOWO2_01_FULL_49_10]|uniref:Glycosyl transferase family 1 domain-containing protein n=1 Tax=Candidatus Gottesmanbacteria bacterium RIFCSPLOWO2_01_FULL_49_10 TaxID=1798396 RepID=A0A1F6AX52_9BACT|nr:MAG: Glycosyl transferase group 1 [Microgenomates group bacterium GW2011_GWA2_47_8]OGG29072.1 MAG: hypothetical protein A2973_00515 [Candidatus Gottesmanbacteria bacterium RIFCSPLOWO2_01_FULL_49_10]